LYYYRSRQIQKAPQVPQKPVEEVKPKEVTPPEKETAPPEKPFIQVISPNGGESWMIGKSYTVKWKSTGVKKVNILLVDYRAPETCYLNDDKIDATLGSFTIESLSKVRCFPGGGISIVDISPGAQYKIKIEDAENPKISDFSDNYFSIVGEGSP
jgi:hypothetical protein